jgi:hypothetical protein
VTLVFDHAGVETTRIEEDARLYVEAFGLSQIRWGTHSGTGGRIAMLSDAEGVKLELIEVESPTGTLAHLAFRSEDVTAARAAAIAAGCVGEGTLRWIEAAKATTAMVSMPSGALVQLIRYEPDSPDVRGVAGGMG